MPATSAWLPDLLFTGARFESGLALVADAQGTILRLSREPADLAAAQRLSGRALLPGLVNAHSHAFHRVIRARSEFRSSAQRDTFWTWREVMFRAATALDPDDLLRASRMAFLEMALSGITTVGEFHYLHRAPNGRAYAEPNAMALALVRAAREVGLRICLLHSAYARAGWRRTPSPAQRRFIIESPDEYLTAYASLRVALASDTVAGLAWTGFAPHSLRAVPPDYLRAILPAMRAHAAPVHMHLSEQTDENEVCLAEHDTTPIGLLEHEGVLNETFTAVHAIHISTHEAVALARAKAHVCACPTTERNLGDGINPADLFFARGLPVALGTDTNVQTDLLEDARELEYHLRLKYLQREILAPAPAPEVDSDPSALATRLLACATRHGAASLHAPGGSLELGRAADFFTVALDDPALAGADVATLPAAIVFAGGRSCIVDVVIGGRPVVANGRHPQQAAIVGDFHALQHKLWAHL
ncbi:MAG: formimidoylglutamate deiminase [Opitutaceae bacterium]|nr:formimidoylglutamate deiminase [Opitutaceae bacterium]